jgi:hypothetical protein
MITASERGVNAAAWQAASGTAPGAILAVLVSALVMLCLYLLGVVVLGLFESVVHEGRSGQDALHYGVRALVVVLLVVVIFR